MQSYESLFGRDILAVIKTGVKILHDFPESKAALMRSFRHLPKAARRRNAHKKRGVTVPPLLIVSTTDECNLRCAGCYSRTNRRDGAKPEMARPQIDGLLEQAANAGCSVILLAGGEPLLSAKWLEAVASRPELLGLVFTNGTLLDDKRTDWFADNRNMIPVLSVEGHNERTNERRGEGVSEHVGCAMLSLSQKGIPFGLSITTGEHNIGEVARGDFLAPFVKAGCRLVIYTEYVPVDESANMFALTGKSKIALQDFCRKHEKGNDLVLIPFPGDESMFNGCLAAGRGFAHIGVSGALEPCPFAAFSDRNVLDTSFVEALSSPLFEKLRSESHLLHEKAGGCALRDMQKAATSI